MPPRSQTSFGGIPFEGGFGNVRQRSEVDNTKLYETLEVPKDADVKEIKKAYRRLSRIHHPDKGGDENKIKEINAAYEILSDAESRKRYDQYGLEGVSDDANSPAAGGAEDLFSMFFGAKSASRRNNRPSRGPDVNHVLQVSLEDLYKGKTKKMAINRKVIIGDVTECSKCNGQGMVTEMKELGPNMVTQVQRPCSDCEGMGSVADKKTERKIVEVYIEKGMQQGQTIKFSEMADEYPNMETGDVNFFIEEKQHEVFNRKGADLVVFKDLSLNQALCGFTWKITHLDGHEILIKTKPGEVIKAGTKDASGQALPYFKMIEGEGMPIRGNPFSRGNLYINFHIQFPESLSPEVVKVLKEHLPDPDVEEDYDPMDIDVEVVEMVDADLKNFGKGGAAIMSSGYESDGDGRPQCQQQ